MPDFRESHPEKDGKMESHLDYIDARLLLCTFLMEQIQCDSVIGEFGMEGKKCLRVFNLQIGKLQKFSNVFGIIGDTDRVFLDVEVCQLKKVANQKRHAFLESKNTLLKRKIKLRLFSAITNTNSFRERSLVHRPRECI